MPADRAGRSGRMASRTSWEGYLRLNLLAVSVKAYNVSISGGGKIRFHMIHTRCHSRIRYKKVCPIHGEVPNEEIVSGYELAKGKYVVVDPDELDKLLPENDKAINIDTFIEPGDLDPIYYGDRTYYLVPDGRVAQKPYAVLQRVMAERGRYAVALMILSGREHVVLLRPVEGLLAMTLLNYEQQVKKPSEFGDEIPDVSVDKQELALAENLIDASTAERFDFERYQDEYTGKLETMLESKASKKKIAKTRDHEEPVVINLMDALRQSLNRAKRGSSTGKASRNGKAKKHAASRRPHRAKAKRKTG
jgi:DNA end-binding protein Ku